MVDEVEAFDPHFDYCSEGHRIIHSYIVHAQPG